MISVSAAVEQIRVLREGALGDDAQALDQAWAARVTFALIPDRTPVDQAWLDRALGRLPARFARDHFALLTSGSTGRPRLVVASRRRAEALVDLLHDAQESESVHETLVVLPLSYCYAFINQWLWARRHGRRLILGRHFAAPAALRKALADANEMMICLVGAQAALLEEHFGEASFPGVCRVHFAGARFPLERIDRIRALFPQATIYNNYGCAEAMPRLSLCRVDEGFVAGKIGRPLPGVELRTEGDEAIAPLAFRSDYGAVALVEGDDLHVIKNGEWIDTGDLAGRQDDRTWRVYGRSNEVFKRYGEKVAMVRVMATMQKETPTSLVGYSDVDGRGEAGFVVVSCPGPSREHLRAMLESLRRSFARPHWPLRIEVVDRIPKLPNAKIDRSALEQAESKTVIWRQRI